MPLSTDVRLPRSQAARFPDRCVVCGVNGPGYWMSLWTIAGGVWSWLAFPFYLDCVKVTAPACPRCARRLRWLRRMGTVVLISVAVAVIVIGRQWIPDRPRRMSKFLYVLAVIGCMAPFWLWQAFHPPPFDVTASDEWITYEFLDAEYAAEFAALNDPLPESTESA